MGLLPMKRVWVLVFMALAGCESSTLVAPNPEPEEIVFENVTVTELNNYIGVVNRAFPAIEVFYTEYGGVTGEAVSGLVEPYWTRQYALNMIRRIEALKATLHGLRPVNPYLRRLHIEELEAAFDDYLDGIRYFESNIDVLSTTVLDGLNQRMGAGNVHLIRLQIFLSDLAGRDVILGDGGGVPGDGQSVGF